MSGIPAAFAHTTVHQMGVAPLLGVSSTTAEIREKVRTHPKLMSQAAASIGLTPREYSAFYGKFMNQKPGWVTIPRHLDGMTWAADGVVHAEYDVEIPAGTNGWEVDLYEKHQIVHVYLPMICGNLSVLRTPRKEVAMRPALPPRRIFAPVPPPPPPVVAPVAPAPVPLTSVAEQIPPVAPPVVHHPRLFWPIVGAAVLAGVLLSHPHHGSTGPATPAGVIQPPGGTTITTPPSGGTVTSPVIPPSTGTCTCQSGGNSSSGWGGSMGGSNSGGISTSW